ncbi:hypothetical protein L596_022086 [Steinernema carpocapsae]|uniref:Uncharacterized protein n=1 Tax=Steinernema carpocapsae TaxID=34508 RepID=A0A4U5MLJ1_STECR|nr:hypothetical protein L596_022086 [Steinernema carpocapsae]
MCVYDCRRFRVFRNFSNSKSRAIAIVPCRSLTFSRYSRHSKTQLSWLQQTSPPSRPFPHTFLPFCSSPARFRLDPTCTST